MARLPQQIPRLNFLGYAFKLRTHKNTIISPKLASYIPQVSYHAYHENVPSIKGKMFTF